MDESASTSLHAGTAPHEVAYEIKPEDWIACNRLWMRSSPAVWIGRATMIAVVAFVFALPVAVGEILTSPIRGSWAPPLSWSEFTLPIAGFLILTTCLGYSWYRAPERAVRQMIARGHGRACLGRTTFRMDANGICVRTNYGEERSQWQVIWKIDASSQRAFFWTTHVTAHIVPQRAFQDHAAFEAFVRQARQYRVAAPQYELHCPKCGHDLRESALGCPECGWRRSEPAA